jgi:hypothetical protein
MSRLQFWFLLAILAASAFGGLWVAFNFHELAEAEAWVLCIKENDQLSAKNLVCRSQYPGAYQRFLNEFQGKQIGQSDWCYLPPPSEGETLLCEYASQSACQSAHANERWGCMPRPRR